jgi:ATP-dependent 26S proteasome regulatory subunit
MTSRPDLLPIRPEAAGPRRKHISLFYPDTEEDRMAIVQAMLGKNKIEHEVKDWSAITRSKLNLSGADIEGMLIRARRYARGAGSQAVTQEGLEKVASEFTPARDETAVEYQTLVAAREATSRDMIPEEYRHLRQSN